MIVGRRCPCHKVAIAVQSLQLRAVFRPKYQEIHLLALRVWFGAQASSSEPQTNASLATFWHGVY
jgi:hypothetical protein